MWILIVSLAVVCRTRRGRDTEEQDQDEGEADVADKEKDREDGGGYKGGESELDGVEPRSKSEAPDVVQTVKLWYV